MAYLYVALHDVLPLQSASMNPSKLCVSVLPTRVSFCGNSLPTLGHLIRINRYEHSTRTFSVTCPIGAAKTLGTPAHNNDFNSSEGTPCAGYSFAGLDRRKLLELHRPQVSQWLRSAITIDGASDRCCLSYLETAISTLEDCQLMNRATRLLLRLARTPPLSDALRLRTLNAPGNPLPCPSDADPEEVLPHRCWLFVTLSA
ncbi:hypothetical protein BD311DRAFT_135311 [Dichomitus squalens]|uniref:Uncharacterized protein n=1 Tax=Dichomitus squalens TaxID=114155 RepID=A0A4Q9MXJ4_9APHY|nr:hypothetical protein BD311DRAFT_135311 [Dichomitus squalens]